MQVSQGPSEGTGGDPRAEELGAARAAALLALAEQVRRFIIDYAERRRREGRAEFHDLLVWARDLLRDHAESRRHFQRRFSHILIDEFQDTDPIQAEIAFLLAGDPDGDSSNGSEPGDWRDVAVVPGKLFVVGDPKQSIYRFRRADIAALGEVRERFGADRRVALTQNFRSQEPVIRWANHVFRQYMTGEAQAAYEDLDARWTPPEADPPLGVHHFGTALGNADAVREAEASALARLITEIERSWRVRDKDAGGDGRVLRPARLRDVCILMPARTNLRAIEYALEDARIAYRIESQTLVLNTQDVREVLNCLRAIDSPADQVAIAAALRSTIFGCSDVELLEFADAGGRFNYFSPGDDGGAGRRGPRHAARLSPRADVDPARRADRVAGARAAGRRGRLRASQAPRALAAAAVGRRSRPGPTSSPAAAPSAASSTGSSGRRRRTRAPSRSPSPRPTRTPSAS